MDQVVESLVILSKYVYVQTKELNEVSKLTNNLLKLTNNNNEGFCFGQNLSSNFIQDAW